MNIDNFLGDKEPSDPRQWVETIHQYFQGMGTEGATEIVATFHTLKLLYVRASQRHDIEVRDQINVMKSAAVTRMHEILSLHEDRKFRRHLRRLFLKTTGDRSFVSLIDWVGE